MLKLMVKGKYTKGIISQEDMKLSKFMLVINIMMSLMQKSEILKHVRYPIQVEDQKRKPMK